MIIRRFTVALLTIVCIFSFAACSEKSDAWPKNGLALQLPEPKSGKLEIKHDNTNNFSASIKEIEENEYENYISSCKEKGFTIDQDQRTSSYSAFNEEGYKLDLYYYSSSLGMSIDLDAPIEMGNLEWPIGSAGKVTPIPSSKKGKIQWEYDDSFYAYIGETTLEEYNDYVGKCIEAGFTVDYSKAEDYYRAYNHDNFYIDVEYIGYNTMSIKVELKNNDNSKVSENTIDQNSTTTEISTSKESSFSESSIEESLSTEISSSNSSESTESTSQHDDSQSSEISDTTTIRTSVKESIDSYEEFIDQYCEFMKTYDSSDTKMLAEYMELLTKEVEFSEKFEAVKDLDLNEAEEKYYAEVSLRCTEKLLEVANATNEE